MVSVKERIIRPACIVLWIVFCAEIIGVLLVSWPRVAFPYDLLYATEGNLLEGGVRIHEGDYAGLYRAVDNGGTVVFGYHPLTYFIIGALLTIFPATVTVTRALSLFSFAATLPVLYLSIPHGKGRIWTIGGLIFALHLFLSFTGYPCKGLVDFPLVFFCAAAVSIGARADVTPRIAFAAAIFSAAAFLTKQPALATSVLLGVHILWRAPRSFMLYAATWTLTALLPLYLFNLESEGAFWLQCYNILSRVPILGFGHMPSVAIQILKMMGIPLCLVAWLMFKKSSFRSPTIIFHSVHVCSWLFAAGYLMAKDGSSVFYFAPLIVSLVPLSAAAIDEFSKACGEIKALILLIAILLVSAFGASQASILTIDAVDHANGARLMDMIKRTSGNVLLDRHQGLLIADGRRPEHDLSQMWWFERRLGLSASESVVHELRNRRYELVLISEDYLTPEIRACLEDRYTRSPNDAIESNKPGRYYYRFVPWRLKQDTELAVR